MITVREIPEPKITVSADETGMVWVNGICTSEPITANGITFVWAPKALGLPAHSKISLDAGAVAKINAHAAAFKAAQREQARRAREFDDLYNEGGEGYNPNR